MSMVGFPLLLIPLAIFNIMVFLMPGVSFAAPVFSLTLMSGVAWAVTVGDLLIATGILLLLFEVIKGARPGGKYFTDHLLSLLIFGGAAAEFVLLPQFGNSVYFLLTALALVDFISGIALRTRRAKRVAASPAPVPAPVPAPISTPLASEPVRQEPRVEAPIPAPAAAPQPSSPPVTTVPADAVIVTPAPAANDAVSNAAPDAQTASEPRPATDTPSR
ncbi:MAG: hypothetical protein BGP05_16180 [Rhizobiales bacterium 62-47]|nr:hypothetical protein [Hyphomicrobiales bacterium]OJY13492.1 MAG: hypothetical protein BGP05_16180 [Rhizobiales bacterium 62-47]